MKKARILAFVLALALVLVACGPATPDDSSGTTQGEHIHSYTKWGYDETNHWKYCEQDNEKDSASVAAHDFSKIGSDANSHWNYCETCGMIQESTKAEHVDENADGKCDICQHAVQIPVQYSTVSGKITLTKAGKSILEAKSVKLVLSDGFDTVEPLELNFADDGTFSFKVIAGEYTLTVSKDGYLNSKTAFTAENGQNVENCNIDLQYNLMSMATSPGWDGELLDFTHQNDEKPYFSFKRNESGKTVDTMTVDAYDNAMFTWYAKRGQNFNDDDRAGVWVQFYNEEAGKTDFLWLTVKGNGNLIEWFGDSLWSDWTNLRNLTNKWSIPDGNMAEAEIAQYEEGTLAVSIARYENMIMAVVNGEVRDTIILDEKYADMDAHFGIICTDGGNAEGEAKFYFDITEGVENLLPEEKIAINLPTVDNVTMVASRKECYAGQGFVVSFSVATGYEVTSFKVGDRELVTEIWDGKLTVNNYNGEEITVKVEESTGDTVSIFEDKDIFGWNDATSKFNPETGKGTITAGNNMVFHKTLDGYEDVAITLYAKKSVTSEESGLFMMLEGGNYVHFAIKHNGERKIEWSLDNWMDQYASDPVKDVTNQTFDEAFREYDAWGQYHFFGEDLKNTYQNDSALTLTDEEMAMFEEGKLKLTMVRHGSAVYVFVNDRYAAMRDFTTNGVMGDEAKTAMAYPGIKYTGTAAGQYVNFEIETDISKYLEKCEGQSNLKFVVNGEHVTVEGKTEGFNIGEIAKIKLVAEEGYTITSIKVNGQQVDGDTVARYILTKDIGEVTVEVTTESGKEEPPVEEPNGELNTKDIWGWNDSESVTDTTTGKNYIYQTNGNMIGNVTKAEYDQVAITQYVKADLTSERSGVLVMLGNRYVQLIIKHSGDDKGVIEWECSQQYDEWSGWGVVNYSQGTIDREFYDYCGWAEWCMFDENLGLRYRNDSASENRLTDEEMAMFEAGTLKLTLVRNGKNIYAFVNDHFIGSRCFTNDVISEEDAQGKVTVGVFASGIKVGDRAQYEIETDISEYLEKCEGQSDLKYVVNGEHVIVEGKTEGFNIGEIAKIKLVAEEGYTITSIKVNGQEVSGDTVARYILYKNMGDVNIEVTTEPTA